MAFRMLGNRADAEDVAQETLARAFARWRRVERYATAWVAKVSANVAIDVIRRQRRDRDRPATGREPARESVAADAYASERLELVAALRRLPRRQREVVVLRYVADLPEAVVAEQLGCSIGAVKQHASRGLHALRALPSLDGLETP